MKVILAFILSLSVSSFANTCFKRDSATTFQLLKNIPMEICLEALDVDLNVFGDSTGTIYFSADGVTQTKESKLTGKKVPGGYRVQLKVYYKDTGFSCFEYENVSIIATALIDSTGNFIRFESVSGRTGFSSDACHDRFDYRKLEFQKTVEVIRELFLSENDPIKRIERFFTNLGIIVFTFVLTFCAIELLMRAFVSFKSYKASTEVEDSIHVLRPYVMSGASPRLKGINTLGYKGDLPKTVKSKDEIRIFFLGGSTVFGHEPIYEKEIGKSLPFYVERFLQKKYGEHVKVFNFGITSSVTQQDLVRLVVDVTNFSPDIVVAYGGGNDLFGNHFDNRVGYPHRFMFYETNPLWKKNINEYPVFMLTAFGSLTLRKLFRSNFENYFMSQDREKFFAEGIAAYQDSHSNYVDSLMKMQRVSKAFGAEFIAFFQPLRSFYYGQKEAIDSSVKFLNSIKRKLSNTELNFMSLLEIGASIPESGWEDEIHLWDKPNRGLGQAVAKILSEKYDRKLKLKSK